jgi:hypothetical protein
MKRTAYYIVCGNALAAMFGRGNLANCNHDGAKKIPGAGIEAVAIDNPNPPEVRQD